MSGWRDESGQGLCQGAGAGADVETVPAVAHAELPAELERDRVVQAGEAVEALAFGMPRAVEGIAGADGRAFGCSGVLVGVNGLWAHRRTPIVLDA